MNSAVTIVNKPVGAARRIGALSLALACATSAARAQVWNAASDFSPSFNPYREWSYGWTPAPGVAFTRLPQSAFYGPSPGWPGGHFWDRGAGTYPDLGLFTTGQISMHPSAAGEMPVLRWTAPYHGRVEVGGDFAGFWEQPVTDADVHVLIDGVSVFDAAVGPRSAPNRPFAAEACVAAGSTIDFTAGVGANGVSDWDRVLLAATIRMCYPDCDCSAAVDIFDFLCFQNHYTAGSAYACDCDQRSGPGACDIFDFLCFSNHFAAGCR